MSTPFPFLARVIQDNNNPHPTEERRLRVGDVIEVVGEDNFFGDAAYLYRMVKEHKYRSPKLLPDGTSVACIFKYRVEEMGPGEGGGAAAACRCPMAVLMATGCRCGGK